MRVTHYHIASGTPERVCEQMRQYIKDGWQPLGAPFMDNAPACTLLYQAVVKVEQQALQEGAPHEP